MPRHLSLMQPGSVSVPSPMTIKRVQREINDLKREDMGGMRLDPTERSILIWTGAIPGPEGSVYEGGLFEFDLQLPTDYPFSAPKIVFKTRIYHMNIAQTGHICLDILKNMWSPALSLFKVMLSLSSLLTDPNPSDPLVPAIASEFKANRERHDATARNWTQLYAINKSAPAARPTPSSSNAPISIPSTSTSRTRSAGPSRISTPISLTSSSSTPTSRPTSGLVRPATTISSTAPRASVNGRGIASSTEVIEISDEEEDPTPTTTAGSKRKRGSRDDGPPADTGTGSSSSSRAVAGRATRQNRSRAPPNTGTTELIVIDDD